MPHLTIIIGANGAGKSTWAQTNAQLLQTPFYNPDIIATGMGDANDPYIQQRVRNIIDAEIRDLIANGESFGFESTYSGKSRPNIVRQAHAKGYRTEAVFLGTDTPDSNIERVQRRFKRGGHKVPEKTIVSRWSAVQDNLIETWDALDEIDIFDTTFSEFRHIATKIDHKFALHVPDADVPGWSRRIVRRGLQRAGQEWSADPR